MHRYLAHMILVVALALSSRASSAAEPQKPPVPKSSVSADVFSAPKAAPIRVTEVEFDFRGYTDRTYLIARTTPDVRSHVLPLSNGLRVPLEKVGEVTFTSRLDKTTNPYELKVAIVVQTTTAQKIEAHLEMPKESGSLFLVGKTDLGAFELQLDKDGRDVRVVVVR